jgi:hypothetical protein
MNGLKIICMEMEHLTFLDSISYLPMPLRKLPDAFGLTARKSWYPHYFNTKANLEYVGSMPDVRYYGIDEMSATERRDFMTWYEEHKDEVFDNRRVLEKYCQVDVTVRRQACQTFRREFVDIGNMDVFLESFTIASACNRVLRKRFLKPDTIGLIPAGGYTANQKYSKKALLWLLHMEQTDGCRILHARNGLEYRLPELPFYSVDGYCVETRTVYEFLVVSGTGANVHRSGIFPQWPVITWHNGMSVQWSELNRYRAPGTKSRFSGSVPLTRL